MSRSGGGSRRATPARESRWGGLGVVGAPIAAAGLLGLAVVAPSTETTAGDRSPRPVRVDQTGYACALADGLTMAAGQLERGSEVTATVLPDGEPDEDLLDPAAWTRVEPGAGDPDSSAVLVQHAGEGSGAVGVVAGSLADGRGGGSAIGSCPGTVDDVWFLGAGSAEQHESTLVLTNLASSLAVADLSFWGEEGPVDAVDSDGVVIEPGTTRRIDLTAVAAGQEEMAVRVQRRRGALSATMLDGSTGATPGSDVIAASEPAARSHVLPGLSDRGERSLLLLTPEETSTTVQVEALGGEGPVVLEGLDGIELTAGRLTEVELPDSLDGTVALRITSSQPVVAGARVAVDGDAGYLAATVAVREAALVPVSAGLGPPELSLTADDGETTVRLEGFDAAMEQVAQGEIEIPAASTRSVDLGDRELLDAAELAYVRLSPSAPVRAAATYRDDGIAILPLSDAPLSALGPDVRVRP